MNGHLAKLKVLVVEDHEFQRLITEQTLNGLGVKDLQQATNGQEALDLLESAEPVDIIICDLDMPEMDGVRFIRHVAEQHLAKAILVASALEPALIRTVEDMAHAHGLQVLGALSKPVSRDRVRELLELFQTSTQSLSTTKPVEHHFSEEELEQAVANQQFVLHYQPKVLVRSGRLVAMEALCRWPHPKEGMISPACFIPLMESTGLITPLTYQLIDQALQQLKNFLDDGRAISIAVNLSALTLTDTDLPDVLSDKVRKLNIPPELLTLEITESTLIENAARSLETLARLKIKGFSLSIDDFGTGYSSMQQLNRIPFSELKIDRSFIQRAHTNLTRKAIIEANISLAHTLKMSTVAEGVENLEEWQLLGDLNCDMAQGFLIGRPMPAEDIKSWEQHWLSRLPLSGSATTSYNKKP